MSFTSENYDLIRSGCQSSAAVVVPLVMSLTAPASVVDVGAGEGWWAAAFAEAGVDRVVAVDGYEVTDPRPGVEHVVADLPHGLPGLGRFGLAVCLEVAEHLPEELAQPLVDALCSLAPVVLFSAAIPHQTGHGHINLQWPSWWAERFDNAGYWLSGDLRWSIWNDDRVEPWYRQNLMLASTEPLPMSGPLDVVHPVIHGWGR